MIGEVMVPKISVVIPACNEEKSISLVINDLPRKILHEIIVVDNNSSDNTKKKVKQLQKDIVGIRYIFEPNTSFSRARNHGSLMARGK